MSWKRTSRRELLRGGGALAGGFTLGAVAPALGQTPALGQAASSRDDDDLCRGRCVFGSFKRVRRGP
jgi:hypothetical protein